MHKSFLSDLKFCGEANLSYYRHTAYQTQKNAKSVARKIYLGIYIACLIGPHQKKHSGNQVSK